MDGWNPVELPEFAGDPDGNDWELTTDAITGNFSLHLESAGDFDDNVISTREKIIDLGSSFSFSFTWRTDDPDNRGPHIELTDLNETGIRDRGISSFPRESFEVFYGGDAVSRKGSPFRGHGRFNGRDFSRESFSAGEAHSAKVRKHGGNSTLFFDGEKQIELPVNGSGSYRLLIGSSGTWGSSSSITFDDISYSEGGGYVTEVNHSLGETLFVGSGRKTLQAVSLNASVVVADRYSEVEEAANRSGLVPVGVGNVEGIRRVRNVNTVFDVNRTRYYVDSREKAVYVAGLAAADNATLTFDPGEAGRNFSRYTVEELQEKFIKRFKPNHVAVADLESDSGLLAAYMAARKGIMPVNFDRNYSYPANPRDTGSEEVNRRNGVEELDRKIEAAFSRIGENEKTVFRGKHVSILHGPRKLYRDPVEKGLLGDPADGNHFYGDLGYGNLDQDSYIEAAVGRYPDSVSLSSKIFRRSIRRQKGKEAVIAAEYLHEEWPVVLATLGGGMWNAKNTGYTMEEQGYRVTRLVEHRSKPLSFFLDLLGMPRPDDFVMEEVKKHEDLLSRYIGRSSVTAIKNGVAVYKTASLAERGLRLYLEFDWIGWKPLDQDIDLPDQPEAAEARELVLSLLPDRYPELDGESLVERARETDILYYHGVGNSSRWIMPGGNSTAYRNRNNFTPEQVPGINRSIVWDSSNQAGRSQSAMKNAFLEKGASNYIGFSSVSYAPYSSMLAREFFRHGSVTGEAVVESVNDLKTSSLIYSPSTLGKTGVKKKMLKSLSVYGNPETRKDPVPRRGMEVERSCSEGVCTLEAAVEPGINITYGEGERRLEFGTGDYLLKHSQPITPLYKLVENLPRNATVIEKDVDQRYSTVENVSRTRLRLVTHGSRAPGLSPPQPVFPERTYRVKASDSISYVQAGLQYRRNSTRLLQRAELEVRYLAPVHIDLEVLNRTLAARVFSRSETNASLSLDLEGNRSTREVGLEKGRNRFNITQLPPGIYRARAVLHGEEVLDSAAETVKVASQPRVEIIGPESVPAGSEKRFSALVYNPNSFTVETVLEPSTGGSLEPGILERMERRLEVPPGRRVKASWRVLATERGTGYIEIGGINRTVEAEAKGSKDISVDRSGASGASIRYSRRDVSLTVNVSDGMELELVTPGYTARRVRSGGRSATRVRTAESTHRDVAGGNSRTVNGSRIEEERLQEIKAELASESGKLLEYYRSHARAESSAKMNWNTP